MASTAAAHAQMRTPSIAARGVAQLGERAREDRAAGLGDVRRGARGERPRLELVVEQHRERAEGGQRPRGAALGGGRHEQRQAGADALELARLEDGGDHVAPTVWSAPSTPAGSPARCPLVKARAALAELGPDDVLVVLATDPEAPIDLAALAADRGRAFAAEREADHWRLVLSGARA